MKSILLAALASALFPFATQAADLSYNYLEAGYGYAHSDNGINTHGWTGDGSVAIGDHFQVFGGGGFRDRDRSNSAPDTTIENWNVGGGFHTPISGQTDFVADASYHRSHEDDGNGHVNTWSGEGGVRSALTPHFEGWAMVGYSNAQDQVGDVDRGSSKGSAFGTLGGQYKFNRNWGMVAEGTITSKSRGILVGPRISF